MINTPSLTPPFVKSTLLPKQPTLHRRNLLNQWCFKTVFSLVVAMSMCVFVCLYIPSPSQLLWGLSLALGSHDQFPSLSLATFYPPTPPNPPPLKTGNTREKKYLPWPDFLCAFICIGWEIQCVPCARIIYWECTSWGNIPYKFQFPSLNCSDMGAF